MTVVRQQSLQASRTNDCSVQVLGLLSVLVSELIEHHVHSFWIRTVQDEMLQQPAKLIH